VRESIDMDGTLFTLVCLGSLYKLIIKRD